MVNLKVQSIEKRSLMTDDTEAILGSEHVQLES
jgi:hypothetical protein